MSTVLVVEDDDLIRECILDLLDERGYTAIGASSGQEALHRIREGLRPDLILLDLMMPVMNGWEFRAEQVKEAGQDTVPVLIITGSGEERKAVKQLRAAGALRKPFAPAELMEAVRQHVGF